MHHSAIPGHGEQALFEECAQRQIVTFRDCASGRLETQTRKLDDDQILALGQHYGLHTPLLDWTESPYVALFFACCSDPLSREQAVWAAHRTHLPALLSQESRHLNFLDIRIDENPRILAQRGLFSRLRGGGCLARAVQSISKGRKDSLEAAYSTVLAKLIIRIPDLNGAIRDLNRMNVAWLSLYPDLEGSARHSNYVSSNIP